MANNLTFEHGIHYEAPAASAGTDVEGAWIPVAGASRVALLTAIDTVAGNAIKLEGTTDGSTPFDLDHATITLTGDGDPIVVECYRLKGVTHVRMNVDRSGTNTAVQSSWWFVGDAVTRPSHGSGVAPILFEGPEAA